MLKVPIGDNHITCMFLCAVKFRLMEVCGASALNFCHAKLNENCHREELIGYDRYKKLSTGLPQNAGVSIIDFTSENSALFISDGATVLLNASVISRNTVSYTWPNSGVISVNSINPDIFGDQLADTIVRLRNCNLEGNDAVHDLIATTDGAIYREMNVSVYSDETRNLFWNLPDPSMSTTLPLSLAPVDRPGIDASTDWFVNLKEARATQILLLLVNAFELTSDSQPPRTSARLLLLKL